MASNNRKKLGKGMKPRGISTNVPSEAKQDEILSAGEVQEQGEKEPVSDGPEAVLTPVKQGPELVQNLESATVAPETGVLDDLMQASRGEIKVPLSPEEMDKLKREIPLVFLGNGKLEYAAGPLGEQPDGTFKIVVSIREGIIEPLRQQAAADNQTPEEWASERFGEYLDQWWSPAQGR